MGQPVIGTQELMEKIVGQPLERAAFRFVPWAHRVLIVREEAPEVSMGGIIIPDQVKEPPAAGWVLSAGPMVGEPSPGMDGRYGGWVGDNADLIGRKVVFGKYAGQALLLGDRRETAYESKYMLLDDYDIWGEVLEDDE